MGTGGGLWPNTQPDYKVQLEIANVNKTNHHGDTNNTCMRYSQQLCMWYRVVEVCNANIYILKLLKKKNEPKF